MGLGNEYINTPNVNDYVHNESENFRMTNTLMVTIGVALCVFSVAPVIIFEEIVHTEYFAVDT